MGHHFPVIFLYYKGNVFISIAPCVSREDSLLASDTTEDLCPGLSIWCECGADVHVSCFLLPLGGCHLLSDPSENSTSHPWCSLSRFLIFFFFSFITLLTTWPVTYFPYLSVYSLNPSNEDRGHFCLVLGYLSHA